MGPHPRRAQGVAAVTAQLTTPAGAEFVERMRVIHVRGDDNWCACGFPHCGIRVLLDHLDHAHAHIARLTNGDTTP
jgi:hypothetical protein